MIRTHNWLLVLAAGIFCPESARADSIFTVIIEPPQGMTRAEVYFRSFDGRPAGILVLCPGINGDGQDFLEEETWRQFAEKHRLMLAGLSFASPKEALRGARRGQTLKLQFA